MYGAWVFLLVCVVLCSGAFPPGDRYARETSKSKQARSLVSAIAKFTEDVEKGMKVTKMKERCERIQEGIQDLAEQIAQIKTADGDKRSAEDTPSDIIVGMGKLKKEAKNIGITTKDVLALTVGNGNMDVDHRRIKLSLKLLDKMRTNELKPDLDALVNAKDVKVASKALEDVQGTLRAISKILDGIEDALTDAEVTDELQRKMNGAAAGVNMDEDPEEDQGPERRGWSASGGLTYNQGGWGANAGVSYSWRRR